MSTHSLKITHSFAPSRMSIVLVILMLFILFLFYRPMEIEDISWHLSTGRWMTEHKQVPHQDPFPFAGETTPWTFTQWLGSLIYYGVYSFGQEEGLKLFRSFLFLGVIMIFFGFASQRLPFSWSILLAFLLALGLDTRGFLRPFVFNFIFIQIFLQALLDFRERKEERKLFLLPLLGIVWGNIHLGSFVYGNLLIGTFLFAYCVDYLNEFFLSNFKSPTLVNNKGWRFKILIGLEKLINARMQKDTQALIAGTTEHIKSLCCLLVIYGCVFFVSPYGLEGGLYPYRTFFQPEHIHFYTLNKMISELNPPMYLFTPSGIWVWCLVVVSGVFLYFNQKDRFLLTVLFLTFLFMFIRSARGSAEFAIVSVYVVTMCAFSIRWKEKWQEWQHAFWIDGIMIGVVLVLCIFHIWAVCQSYVVVQGKKYRTITLDYVPFNPRRALDFMGTHGLTGPVFCDDINGGFVIWHAYPQIKPFTDSRQVNQEQFFKYVVTAGNPQKNWPVLEEEYGLRLALLDASLPVGSKLIRYLHDHPSWKLVFIDGVYLIFVKEGSFLLSDDLKTFEERLEKETLTPEDFKRMEVMGRKISAPPMGRVKRWLTPPPIYVDRFQEGLILYKLGYVAAGIKRMLMALESTPEGMAASVIKQEKVGEIFKKSVKLLKDANP